MSDETERVGQQEVEIVRAVRFGRILLFGAAIGAITALIMTLVREVPEGALYEMAQIAGFMIVVGAVIGLVAGAVFALILNLIVRKKHGHGVARHEEVLGEGHLEGNA